MSLKSFYAWPNSDLRWENPLDWEARQWGGGGPTLVPRRWQNAPRNFDSVAASMLTLFEVATLDHWVKRLLLAPSNTLPVRCVWMGSMCANYLPLCCCGCDALCSLVFRALG